jgi:hypothetical protein
VRWCHKASLNYNIFLNTLLIYSWILLTILYSLLNKSRFKLCFSLSQSCLCTITIVECKHIDRFLRWIHLLFCYCILLRLALLNSGLWSIIWSYYNMLFLLTSISPTFYISSRSLIKFLEAWAAFKLFIPNSRWSFYLRKVFSVILRLETA